MMPGIGKFAENVNVSVTANDMHSRNDMDYMETTRDEFLIREEKGIGANINPNQLAGTHRQEIKSGVFVDQFDGDKKDLNNGEYTV